MQRKLEHIRSIEQMKSRYHKKVPKMFAQYCDSGSWSQTTYHANEKDFRKYCFRQRVLVDIKERTLATKILGTNYTMPVILAPTGLLGMQDADGEILAAKALGARAGMIGRAFIYGLGAYGEDGVRRVLEILYDELDKTMAFCGHTNINYINQNILTQSTF